MLKFISALISAVSVVSAGSGDFTYNGAKDWHLLDQPNNKACTPSDSSKQSPIDLVDASESYFGLGLELEMETYPNMLNA